MFAHLLSQVSTGLALLYSTGCRCALQGAGRLYLVWFGSRAPLWLLFTVQAFRWIPLRDLLTNCLVGNSFRVLWARLVTGLCPSPSRSLWQAQCWTSSSTSSLAVSTSPVCWTRPASPPSWRRCWRGSSTSTRTGRFIGGLCWFVVTAHSVDAHMCHHTLLSQLYQALGLRLCMSVQLELDLTPSIFNTGNLHNWVGLFYIKVPPRNIVDPQ